MEDRTQATVCISQTHPFFVNFDQKLKQHEKSQKSQVASTEELENLIKSWYGYDIELEPYGLYATLKMTPQQRTVFLLKFGT